MKQMIVCSVVVGGLALAACASEYCSTSKWFSVETGTLGSGAISVGMSNDNVGSWTEVPSDGKGTASVENGKILIGTDHTSPLAFAPVTTVEPMARLTSRITLTVCDERPTLTGTTAICVAPVSGETKLKWHVWNGTDWIAGGALSDDDIGQEFDVTLETDVTNQVVRYTAKRVGADTAQGWTSDWISCSSLTKQVASVSFYGSTELSDLSGVGVRKVQLAEGVDEKNIEVVVIQDKPGSGIVVDKESAWMKAYNVSPANMNNAPENGNGLTYLQSYVLGLDPTKPMSRPFVKAEQDDKTEKITFKLGVDVNASSGARVSYCVKAFEDPAGGEPVGGSSSVAAGQAIEMDLPTSGAAARYYRVEVSIE